MTNTIKFETLELIEHKKLHRELKVVIPAEMISKKVNQEIQNISKKARIPGFRHGKVPKSEVVRRYGDDVQEQVISEVTQQSFEQAVREKGIKLAGEPVLDYVNKTLGEPLEYTIKFEAYPEIKLVDLSTLKLVEPNVVVDQKAIDEGIETLRKEHRSWSVTDKAVRKGCQLIIDFSGSIDGELFDGGQSENFEFIIGEGKMLEDFEAPLYKHKGGDEVTLSITFPEDYHAKDLQGKEAIFKVKIHQVAEGVLPEVDEEFIKKMGIESGQKDELIAQVSDTMKADLDHKIKELKRTRAGEALIKKHKVMLRQMLRMLLVQLVPLQTGRHI